MTTEMQEVEISIKDAQAKIERAEQLSKLLKTPEWDSIIEKGYFVNEASNTVLLRAAPQFQEDKHQELLLKQIDGIGMFRQYLMSIFQVSKEAKKALEDLKAMKDDLLNPEE